MVKIMKKLLALLIALLVLTCPVAGSANDVVEVYIEGYQIEFDVPPQIIEGRTMVPMRKIFEALGAEVEWVGELRLVLATYETSIIAMPIGENAFTVTDVITNQTVTYPLDVPATIIDGRTLIPVRAVSEAIGKKVDWDGENRHVLITEEEPK